MNQQPTNVENGKRVDVIHGECYIRAIDKAPENVIKKETKSIVGHSETGHHHIVMADIPFEVMAENDKQDLYLRLFEPAQVVHQKTFDIHETQTLAPGDYAVFHKTEYDPFAEVVRAVYD